MTDVDLDKLSTEALDLIGKFAPIPAAVLTTVLPLLRELFRVRIVGVEITQVTVGE